MTKKFSFFFVAYVLQLCSVHASAREPINVIEVAPEKSKGGLIKRVHIRHDGILDKLNLPPPGAIRSYFSVEKLIWEQKNIVAITLDGRGQIPIIAYYEIGRASTCLIGEYATLIFHKKTGLVVEPMYSSAVEQIINRYTYEKCKLEFYDQLDDKVISDSEEKVLRRSVRRVKGSNLPKYQCEYKVLDENSPVTDECYKR